MKHKRESDCSEMLLDMLCYELLTRKLSPEMQDLLDRHMRCCPACRRKVLGFLRTVGGNRMKRNFG